MNRDLLKILNALEPNLREALKERVKQFANVGIEVRKIIAKNGYYYFWIRKKGA